MIRFILVSLVTLTAFAGEPTTLRWTAKEDANADIHHILEVIKQKSGVSLSTNNLMLVEERPLATSQFLHFAQTKNGSPIRGRVVRIWKNLKSGELIQAEAQVEAAGAMDTFKFWGPKKLDSQATMLAVRETLKNLGEDTTIKSVKWNDVWNNGVLVRDVTVKGRRGTHKMDIRHEDSKVLNARFEEYPKMDAEFSLPVKVYPIFEEAEGNAGPGSPILPRINSQLKYLKSQVTRVETNPYLPLQTQHYTFDQFDPLLGLTVEGRQQGFWAMSYIKDQARTLFNTLPKTENNFANGLILQGRYATISIDPLATDSFKNLSFTPKLSGQFLPIYKTLDSDPTKEEMVPGTALLGRPITSFDDALMRPARRLKDHDPATYINDGFDEIQVYWAITQLFDSLHTMGFVDPDISTRPFNAFLYNPDISMRDNAFYTDDTINFTTYSEKNQNYARDNSTIWHELGHGVMDRLMGDLLNFNDTGGLSEGMADFVAQLVINDLTGGLSFPGKENLRIFNNTGFYLTNEVHDDGEAYGGAMNDLLMNAMGSMGRDGLVKVTDLTLEAMRLTRNHPGLTAREWFDHMLFADELGSPNRAPGELKALIVKSLNGRNFVFDNTQVAQFSLKNGADEVTSSGPGSRNNPIRLKLKPEEKASFGLSVSLQSSATYNFTYPVTIKVDLQKGPLQGAIHWQDEDKNPLTFTLKSDKDVAQIPLTAFGKCDEINRPDNSCVDYAYVQVWNKGDTEKPHAKKRFYLRVYPQ